MGDSGNSEGSVPHAHVEILTPDGCHQPLLEPAPGTARRQLRHRLAQRRGGRVLTAVDGLDPAGLPGDWTALEISGGRPGSGRVASRMWIGPAGFTPIDAAAVRVGDARYDGDCAELPPEMAPAPVPAELGSILATIRFVESWGDGMASRSSTASGAYQFLDSTWAGYGGYRRARTRRRRCRTPRRWSSSTPFSVATMVMSPRSRSPGTSGTPGEAPSGTRCRPSARTRSRRASTKPAGLPCTTTCWRPRRAGGRRAAVDEGRYGPDVSHCRHRRRAAGPHRARAHADRNVRRRRGWARRRATGRRATPTPPSRQRPQPPRRSPCRRST